jgi:hypothetical protein
MGVVDLTPHVYCPPMILMRGVDQAGYLLAWLQVGDGSWQAVVTWIREVGDTRERKVVTVSGGSVQQLEAPAAYRDVPRLMLDGDTVRPWERPAPEPP